MQPYKVYKDSGVPWIGKIPENWEIKPLYSQATDNKEKNTGNNCDNLLSLSYGKIKRKDINTNMGLLPESFETYQIVEQGMTVLRLTDLQNDQRSLRTGFVNEKGIITSAYVGLCPQKTIDPYFLYQLLHFYDTIKVFYGLGAGVRQSMKYNELKKLQIVLPPLETQRKITAYLDHKTSLIDSIISDKEEMLTLLAELRQAIISEAVTKGLDPHAEMKDSGVEWIGEIPVGWEKQKLNYICSKIGDGLHGTPNYDDSGEYYFFNGNNFKNGVITIKSDTKRVNLNEYEKYQVPLDETTLLLSINGTIGNVAVYRNEKCILGKSACYLNVKSSVSKNFIKYTLSNYAFSWLLQHLSTGTTIKNASLQSIRDYVLYLPPIEIQEQIVQYLDEKTQKIDQITADTKEQIALLKEYRQSLISEVVTGKVEV